jgi:nitrate/nitrite transporter NarK
MVMAIVGPVLAVELGLSAIELGALAASLFAAYAAAQLPLGVALDGFGARRVQTVLMLLAASRNVSARNLGRVATPPTVVRSAST